MKQKPYTIYELGKSVTVLFSEPTQYEDFEAELLEELKGEASFTVYNTTTKEFWTVELASPEAEFLRYDSMMTNIGKLPSGAGTSKRSGAIRQQDISNS